MIVIELRGLGTLFGWFVSLVPALACLALKGPLGVTRRNHARSLRLWAKRGARAEFCIQLKELDD